MEAAPVLGFGDAFLPTVDRDELRGKINDAETLLCYVLRVCYTHIDRGIPPLPHLCREDYQRIRNFKYLDSPQAVEEFKAWVVTLPDPTGELTGCVFLECPPDDWHLMEATTNLGEAQHAWNNSQTGIGMGIIESFQKYAELDARRAAEIENMLSSGNLNNPHNEVVDRYASRNRRRAAAAEKGRHAQAADENVHALERARAENKAAGDEIRRQLKQAKAEAKSSSSRRAYVSRPRKNMDKSASARPSSTPENSEVITASEQPETVIVFTPQTSSVAETSAPTVAAAACEQSNSSGDAHVSRPRRTKNTPTTAATSTSRPSTAATSLGKRKKASSTTESKSSRAKRSKKDPLGTWSVERVEGDDIMVLTGREFATLYPDEFREIYPQEVKHI
ncbi:hypothetical protein MVEN_00129300 [Mycena venus]|uniref:Uncharacterized protein n=1 Tax=Mycena venus TaxID=2733690 RepID=A0A8H6Z854_9AGAR|nr:hypothetical protein MVEN_00129300 [Mycena venus]